MCKGIDDQAGNVTLSPPCRPGKKVSVKVCSQPHQEEEVREGEVTPTVNTYTRPTMNRKAPGKEAWKRNFHSHWREQMPRSHENTSDCGVGRLLIVIIGG